MTSAEHLTRIDQPPDHVFQQGADAETQLDRLLASARDLRPNLLAEQETTERRSRYSAEMHEKFLAAGFYRMLQPLRFGGLELGVAAFYKVIAMVARGCPSTAWCLALGAGHSLQIGSYFSERAQHEIFTSHGYCISPVSGNASKARVSRASGGYRISGKWSYCSGAPYSTHFMGIVTLPHDGLPPEVRPGSYWFVVPRGGYTVLEDWTGVIGLRGSGSNSIVLKDAFVPDHLLISIDDMQACDGHTAGTLLHDNPLYGGTYTGYSEGDITAVACGTALAAIDEYVRLVMKPNSSGQRRAAKQDYQRWLGNALSMADSAMAICVRGGQLYEEQASRSVKGVAPFDQKASLRLRSMYFTAQQLAAETVETLLRMAGSGATMDGQRMQRYSRDMLAIRTRFDQLERIAPEVGRLYLALEPA
ncbi:hypothetical protein [Micromonospora sp. NPDC049662]|uniref:hypothetical protein n=1 Tax=Micromonospora sp. NPDC049662 TaxID=3155397 RepID=UPI00341C75C4